MRGWEDESFNGLRTPQSSPDHSGGLLIQQQLDFWMNNFRFFLVLFRFRCTIFLMMSCLKGIFWFCLFPTVCFSSVALCGPSLSLSVWIVVGKWVKFSNNLRTFRVFFYWPQSQSMLFSSTWTFLLRVNTLMLLWMNLTVIAPQQQLRASIGPALEPQLRSRRPPPAQASTRSSSRRLSADTQTQLPVVTPVVLCRGTHLQDSNRRNAQNQQKETKQIRIAKSGAIFNSGPRFSV